jgi:hypothetical protein
MGFNSAFRVNIIVCIVGSNCNNKGFYTYKHVFNMLLVLNVEVSLF